MAQAHSRVDVIFTGFVRGGLLRFMRPVQESCGAITEQARAIIAARMSGRRVRSIVAPCGTVEVEKACGSDCVTRRAVVDPASQRGRQPACRSVPQLRDRCWRDRRVAFACARPCACRRGVNALCDAMVIVSIAERLARYPNPLHAGGLEQIRASFALPGVRRPKGVEPDRAGHVSGELLRRCDLRGVVGSGGVDVVFAVLLSVAVLGPRPFLNPGVESYI